MPRPRYERVLVGFEAFLRAWEPHLADALPRELAAGAAARSRLAFARADLAALAVKSADHAPTNLRQILPLPDLPSALGSMYVLEGSALGGQLIARQVAAHLGLHAGHGAAYFNGWGDATGRHWREFRETLAEHVPATGPACDSACASARRTFELLIDTFRAHLHEPAAA